MLLLSVDRSYESLDAEKAKSLAQGIFKKFNLEWKNVFEPDGWNGVMRNFNSSGYGQILIDPKGIVLGAGLNARDMEALLKKVYPGS